MAKTCKIKGCTRQIFSDIKVAGKFLDELNKYELKLIVKHLLEENKTYQERYYESEKERINLIFNNGKTM